jgi:DNA-binding HxlR family transcriptional regulator
MYWRAPTTRRYRHAWINAVTPLGRSLAEAIVPLCTWGTENAVEMARIFAGRDALP